MLSAMKYFGLEGPQEKEAVIEKLKSTFAKYYLDQYKDGIKNNHKNMGQLNLFLIGSLIAKG